jgi:hypothetical protein
MSRIVLDRRCKNSNSKTLFSKNAALKNAALKKSAPKKLAAPKKSTSKKLASNVTEADSSDVIVNAIGKFIRKNINIKKPRKFLVIDIDVTSKNILQAKYDIEKYILILKFANSLCPFVSCDYLLNFHVPSQYRYCHHGMPLLTIL